jgi:hypothetical protein
MYKYGESRDMAIFILGTGMLWDFWGGVDTIYVFTWFYSNNPIFYKQKDSSRKTILSFLQFP